jgi:hypothetical protein
VLFRSTENDTVPRIRALEDAVKRLLQRGGTWNDTRLRAALEAEALEIEPKGLLLVSDPGRNAGRDSLNNTVFERNLRESPNPMNLKLLGAALQNLVNSGLIEEGERGFKWKR